ncbi:helix-turn-helix domain-containing protein [Mycolicibacterium sp. 120270]|uniref:helix-turn-helix domain-containing protein n=1 Tax=Mycolicibacterium sp. 120270 TaxID=3090600 RepID=UPI00299CFB5D|nr:helix-turn-helix domain-containing protein [Mycolicibacterium sp. 120270]MDX1881861.1 helix-turn-helix domain-containing protein [Mycolicibacterium sp. 120270]
MTTAAAPAPEYLDEKQTAAKIGIKPGSLRADRHRGVGLPYVRIAHRIRYRVADVEAYLASHTITPGTPVPQQE